MTRYYLPAAVYHYHKVPKYITHRKVFGCYKHDNMATGEGMMHAIPLHVSIPVSRHTTWKADDMKGKTGIKVSLRCLNFVLSPCNILFVTRNRLQRINRS